MYETICSQINLQINLVYRRCNTLIYCMYRDEMIVITVSTKYHDVLEVIIPQNHRFFTCWYIITHPNDKDTIHVVEKFQGIHTENTIVLVYYDFYADNRIFNKGGAIRHVQINQLKDYNGPVLLLDSDIYLPDNFDTIMKSFQIDINTLYGVRRHDFHTFKHFTENRISEIYRYFFVGYFQLYHHNGSQFLYTDSRDASVCDDKFMRLFRNKILIKDLTVKHLGKKNVNWQGRKKMDFFP